MIIQKLRVWWLGIWASLFGRGEENFGDVHFRGEIARQRQQLDRLRESMTNMIFQRKTLEGQRQRLQAELLELDTDIRTTVAENREELAVRLMAQQEGVQGDLKFVEHQMQLLENDIQQGRSTENQLRKAIAQAEQMMGTVASRYQALRVRKELRRQFTDVTHSINSHTEKLMQPLEERIHRLEAEMEVETPVDQPWEKDLRKLRENRLQQRFKDRFRQLRDQHEGKTAILALPQ